MSPAQLTLLLRLLDAVAFALHEVPLALADYRATRAVLGKMVDEDRDPTATEWAELNGRLNFLHDVLAEAAALAERERNPVEPVPDSDDS